MFKVNEGARIKVSYKAPDLHSRESRSINWSSNTKLQ